MIVIAYIVLAIYLSGTVYGGIACILYAGEHMRDWKRKMHEELNFVTYKNITNKDFKRSFGNTMHECLVYCFMLTSPVVFLFPSHFHIWLFTCGEMSMTNDTGFVGDWPSDYHLFSLKAIVNSLYFVPTNLLICAGVFHVFVLYGLICWTVYWYLFVLLISLYHFLIWRPFVSEKDTLVISPENKVEKIKGIYRQNWFYYHVKYKGYRLPNAGDLHKITEYLEG